MLTTNQLTGIAQTGILGDSRGSIIIQTFVHSHPQNRDEANAMYYFHTSPFIYQSIDFHVPNDIRETALLH